MSGIDVFTRLFLEASLRVALILALAGIAAWLARRQPAALRHGIWAAGLLASLVMPFAPGLALRWNLAILPATGPRVESSATELATVLPTTSEAIGSVSGRSAVVPWPVALPFLWLAGVVAMAVRELRRRRRLARMLSGTTPSLEANIVRAFRDASSQLRIGFPIECRTSPTLAVPIACGIERPIVVLPEAAAGWTPAVLRNVFLHELSHLRRGDALWLWLVAAARATYWFHPVVWLATDRLLAESEKACDDAVMRLGEAPSSYAETLLFVAAPTPGERHAALAFARRHGLERRIGEVLDRSRNLRALGNPGRTVLTAVAIVLGAFLSVAQPVPGTADHEGATPAPEAENPKAWKEGGEPKDVTVLIHDEPNAPLRLNWATAQVTRGESGDDVRVARPRLIMVNEDRKMRAVVAVRLALQLPTTLDRFWRSVEIPPGGTGRLVLSLRDWSAVVPADDARLLVVRIAGIRFSNGDTWKDEPAEWRAPKSKEAKRSNQPAPRATPNREPLVEIRKDFLDEPTVPAIFRNPEGSSVVIVGARTPTRVPESNEPGTLTYLPAVKIENRSDLGVVGLRIRYKADDVSHAVSGHTITIKPHGTVVLQRREYEIHGRPEDMTVQLLGVRFADGSIYGTLDSTIHSADAWADPLE